MQHSRVLYGGAPGGRAPRSPETQTGTRASSRATSPQPAPWGRTQSSHLSSACNTITSARLRRLGRPQPACAAGRGKEGWLSPLLPRRTRPEMSPAVGRTAPSCCSTLPNLNTQATPSQPQRQAMCRGAAASPTSSSQTRLALTQGLGPFRLPGWGGEPAEAIPNSPNLLQREGRNMGGESRWGPGMWPAQQVKTERGQAMG